MKRRPNKTPGPKTNPEDARDRKVTVYLTTTALAERVRRHPQARTISDFAEKAFVEYLAKVGG